MLTYLLFEKGKTANMEKTRSTPSNQEVTTITNERLKKAR